MISEASYFERMDKCNKNIIQFEFKTRCNIDCESAEAVLRCWRVSLSKLHITQQRAAKQRAHQAITFETVTRKMKARKAKKKKEKHIIKKNHFLIFSHHVKHEISTEKNEI